jgi:hypothetical protein
VSEHTRYRSENGEPCIDIKIASVERIFDNRDPAPFRERDLDPNLVEYMLAAAEDLVSQDRFRIIFWTETPCPPDEIEAACRSHFNYELDRIDRQRRRRRRIGQIALLLAAIAIIALMSLAQVVGTVIPSTIGLGLKEGLVISSWVLMWKPVEVLIYDWIPWRSERKIIRRLLEMPIDVRSGKGPNVEPVRHAVVDDANVQAAR